MPTNTWVASSAGLASNPANWSLGRAPITSDDVVFDGTSVNNCSWDVAGRFAVSLLTGYSGTVSITVNGVELDDTTVAAGTIRGDTFSRGVTWHGNVTQTGGTIGAMGWILRGEGKTITLPASWAPNGLVNYGSYIIQNAGGNFNRLFSNYGTLVLNANFAHNPANAAFINGGKILGTGTLTISTTTGTVLLGDCQVAIVLNLTAAADAAAVKVQTLPLSYRTLTVQSQHATHTITLDTAGHPVSGGAITIGTRGAVLWRSSLRYFSGTSYDSSAASGDDAGTSQLVLVGKGAQTIKRLAGTSEHDVIARSGSVPTLGADLTISNRDAHVEPWNDAGYTRTHARPGEEYTGLRRPHVKQMFKRMLIAPGDLALEGLERVL